MAPASLSAQYYFTGEVKDPHGDKLQNVSIVVQSTGSRYRTGMLGDYRIVSDKADDSLSFSVDGYLPYKTSVSASEVLQVTMKMKPFPATPVRDHLTSFITGVRIQDSASATTHGPYNSLVENPFVGQSAVASFPGNFSRASYNYIQRFLDMGMAVPPDAVKIEEMLNYFNLDYEEPAKKNIFHCSSDLFTCPWNAAHKLLYLDICARKADLQKAPPANLVLLIDASGSMDMPNKMPLVKSALHLLVKNLRDIDTVSIVAYGRRVEVVAGGLAGSETEPIIRAIEGLRADGPTPGETGIRLAYKVARDLFIPGGNNKIVLLTDGDINEGISTENELEDFVQEQSEAHIRLSCIGIGMDSSKYSRLARLAEKGQGNFAYVTEEQDAEKLLLNELAPAACSVADNMCITTEFNRALVSSYRLIGFDNKKSVLQDTSLHLEGGGIGSGHSVFALFELVPIKDTIGLDTIAQVKIKYCLPGQNPAQAQTMNFPCPNDPLPLDKATDNAKKAACIALFGMKLKGSAYTAQISWAEMDKMFKKTFAGNFCMDRQYIALVAKARKIYDHSSPHSGR